MAEREPAEWGQRLDRRDSSSVKAGTDGEGMDDTGQGGEGSGISGNLDASWVRRAGGGGAARVTGP